MKTHALRLYGKNDLRLEAFELPPSAPRRYTLKSPWKADANLAARAVAAEAECRLELQPFEVRILEALP